MEQLIPITVAAELIDARIRSQASMGQHMVLHEALALLIGQLHRAGVVDADRLAADLLQAFSDPEIAQSVPGVGTQAETLAGRIRGAAHP